MENNFASSFNMDELLQPGDDIARAQAMLETNEKSDDIGAWALSNETGNRKITDAKGTVTGARLLDPEKRQQLESLFTPTEIDGISQISYSYDDEQAPLPTRATVQTPLQAKTQPFVPVPAPRIEAVSADPVVVVEVADEEEPITLTILRELRAIIETQSRQADQQDAIIRRMADQDHVLKAISGMSLQISHLASLLEKSTLALANPSVPGQENTRLYGHNTERERKESLGILAARSPAFGALSEALQRKGDGKPDAYGDASTGSTLERIKMLLKQLRGDDAYPDLMSEFLNRSFDFDMDAFVSVLEEKIAVAAALDDKLD